MAWQDGVKGHGVLVKRTFDSNGTDPRCLKRFEQTEQHKHGTVCISYNASILAETRN